MQNATMLWAAVGLLVLAAAGYAWRSRERGEWGFVELIKNPELWGEYAAQEREVERGIAAAARWDDAKLEAAVRAFVLSGSGHGVERRVLTALGPRVHAAALGLLQDTTVRSQLLTPQGNDPLLAKPPFSRACDLLEEEPPAAAVGVLAPFLSDPQDEVRKQAALVIGSTGHPSILPHIETALRDDDQFVRSYALMGLERARKRDALSDELGAGLVTALMDLLRRGHNGDDATTLLVEIDRDRAAAFLRSEDVLRADGPVAHEALEALSGAGLTVERARLLELIEALEAGPMEYPRQYALGEALAALGLHADPADRELLEAHLDQAEERVASGASTGLVRLHGLDGFEDRIWKADQAGGQEALSAGQRHYLAVMMCDAEVNNGGFAQYFANSSGDQWRDAVAGFKAAQSIERLALLEKALAVFGDGGPSEDRDKRQDQLAKIYRRNDEVFSEFEDAWYDSTENVEVLMHRYVLTNPEAFR